MAAINNEPHCVPCYQKLKEEHEQKQRMAQQMQMQHNLEGRAAATQAASSAGQVWWGLESTQASVVAHRACTKHSGQRTLVMHIHVAVRPQIAMHAS